MSAELTASHPISEDGPLTTLRRWLRPVLRGLQDVVRRIALPVLVVPAAVSGLLFEFGAVPSHELSVTWMGLFTWALVVAVSIDVVRSSSRGEAWIDATANPRNSASTGPQHETHLPYGPRTYLWLVIAAVVGCQVGGVSTQWLFGAANGLFAQVINVGQLAELGLVLSVTAAILVGRWCQLEDRLGARQREIDRLQATTIALRRSPHFLNNSLNSLAALIDIDPARAEQMTIQLARFHRQLVAVSAEAMIPLEQELQTVEDYLRIEALRHGSKLRWKINVDATTFHRNPAVPAFILQPMVENAIVHGIARMRDTTTIQIAVKRYGDSLEFRVDNAIPDPVKRLQHEPVTNTGTALADLADRMRLMGGSASRVQILSTHPASIWVPDSLPPVRLLNPHTKRKSHGQPKTRAMISVRVRWVADSP